MLDELLRFDTLLFYIFNGTLTNSLFDAIMPIVTEVKNWIPLYIILFAWLLWKRRREGAIVCLMLIIGVIIGDQFNSSYLKEWAGRIRPCHVLEGARLVGVQCGGGKSFPSSHAVNNFMAAALLGYYLPKRKYWWFGIAAFIAYSRVYVGVHYPLDILAGAVEGMMLSFGLIVLQQYAARKSQLFSISFETPINEVPSSV